MPEELSPSEAATRIGATTRSVQRWIATGRLPARRVGGRWRVASDAVDALRRDPTAGARSIGTLFIANRGEIAARIERTCRALGIRAVVPPTDGPDAVDLLDPVAVVAAARAARADAVHPGYGFLAERADFADAVIEAGLAWVGPPADAIRRLGDKAAARRLAEQLGVPILAGYHGTEQSDAALASAADRVGYPLLVKPSAGGGGKGMHVVATPDALPGALATARREARAAFGDERLILERYLEGPRHVEVQVLGDAHGARVHLGERDCSVQRRHQKVLEEAPSPAVSRRLRARMGQAALRLADAVGYASAGTCEFLLDDAGHFFFLEMNTRLQVEHPVTELVTGRDLVADQLRIAAGEPLGLRQADVEVTGHAVEVRLYAEDAEAGFLPATGRVRHVRWPAGDGIRVDAGIAVGDEVGARFDPMLAKIIAHGRDRGDALARLAAALDRTLVLGLVTNLRFLRWLVGQPDVVAGEARVDWLERAWPPADWAAHTALSEAAWSAAAAALVPATGDPWGGGWRPNAPPAIRLRADGEERTVTALAPSAAPALAADGDTVHVDADGRSVAVRIAPPPDVDRSARAAAAGAQAGALAELVAPMPGAVISVHVDPGTTVRAGDPIVTLEAMKMEHVVAAPSAGRVQTLLVRVGDQVVRGQPIGSVSSATVVT